MGALQSSIQFYRGRIIWADSPRASNRAMWRIQDCAAFCFAECLSRHDIVAAACIRMTRNDFAE